MTRPYRYGSSTSTSNAARICHAEAILGNRRRRQPGLEDPGGVAALHRDRVAAVTDDADPFGPGPERANKDVAVGKVRAKDGERITMPRIRERREPDPFRAGRRLHRASPALAGTPWLESRTIHWSRSDSSGRSPGPPIDVMPAAW